MEKGYTDIDHKKHRRLRRMHLQESKASIATMAAGHAKSLAEPEYSCSLGASIFLCLTGSYELVIWSGNYNIFAMSFCPKASEQSDAQVFDAMLIELKSK